MSKTNVDRIREMSIEKLTEFICGLNEHCLAGMGYVIVADISIVLIYVKRKQRNGWKAR